MRKTCFLTILVASFLIMNRTAYAQDTGFGLGFIVGEPTGISFKGWVGNTQAIDGAVAWSLGHGNVLNVHMDYLFHNYDLIRVGKGKLPLYYGPGARIRAWQHGEYWHHGEWHPTDGHADIAFRFPVGLDYQFDGTPLDVFLEAVPTLGVLPATYFGVGAGLGIRYWF